MQDSFESPVDLKLLSAAELC